MRKTIYFLAILLFAVLHFSCQKGYQWNRTRVKGIVVDGNDNPLENVRLDIFEYENTNSPQTILHTYSTFSDSNGEYKFEAFRAERSDDFECMLTATGPTPNKGYQSMNWWKLDVGGDVVYLKKGRDYKIKITFR